MEFSGAFVVLIYSKISTTSACHRPSTEVSYLSVCTPVMEYLLDHSCQGLDIYNWIFVAVLQVLVGCTC